MKENDQVKRKWKKYWGPECVKGMMHAKKDNENISEIKKTILYWQKSEHCCPPNMGSPLGTHAIQ